MSKDGVKRPRDTISEMLLEATVRTRHSLNRPWIGAETPSHSFWTWAFVIAVGWHALFWVLLSQRRVAYPAVAAAPAKAHYMAGAPVNRVEAAARGDARGIWSPVLFALPSAMGFSGPMLDREVTLRPPVDTPGGQSVLLPLTQRTRRPGTRDAAVLQGQTVLPREFALLPERSPVFTNAAWSADSPFEVVFSPPLGPAATAEGLDLGPADAAGEKPWEASAYITIDRDGRVTQVFIQEPAPVAAWNGRFLRALWRSHFAEQDAEVRGQVVVRYSGHRDVGESAGGVPPE